MSETGASGRTFASRYRRGVILTPPGILFAPLLILPGLLLFRQVLIAVLFALAAAAAACAIFAVGRRRKPALILSEAGVEIDGLALLPWREVASVRRDPDSRGEAGLLLRLKRPLALAAPGRSARASPMWRLLAEDVLVLRAELLEDQPQDIESAFRFFLGR